MGLQHERADRVQTVGGATYTMKASGNLTARGSDSFGYDAANRLVSATVSGTTRTYVYDGDGKRINTTSGSRRK